MACNCNCQQAPTSVVPVAKIENKGAGLGLRTLIQYVCKEPQYAHAAKVIDFVASRFSAWSGLHDFIQVSP